MTKVSLPNWLVQTVLVAIFTICGSFLSMTVSNLKDATEAINSKVSRVSMEVDALQVVDEGVKKDITTIKNSVSAIQQSQSDAAKQSIATLKDISIAVRYLELEVAKLSTKRYTSKKQR